MIACRLSAAVLRMLAIVLDGVLGTEPPAEYVAFQALTTCDAGTTDEQTGPSSPTSLSRGPG